MSVGWSSGMLPCLQDVKTVSVYSWVTPLFNMFCKLLAPTLERYSRFSSRNPQMLCTFCVGYDLHNLLHTSVATLGKKKRKPAVFPILHSPNPFSMNLEFTGKSIIISTEVLLISTMHVDFRCRREYTLGQLNQSLLAINKCSICSNVQCSI